MTTIKQQKIGQLQGFTLIEIMVAMVILSMIMLMLFSSLFTANKYWKIGENKIEKNNEVRLVSSFIRKQISQTVPILWIDDNKRKLLFEGKRDELFFTSTLPSHRGGGGIHSLTLKVIQIDNKNQLGMVYSLLTPDVIPFSGNADGDEQFVTIANDIDSIHLSYYGKEKSDEDSGWFDVWKNDNYLPQLVRIQINSHGETTDWSVMDIPIKASYVNGQPEFMIRANST